MSSVPHSCGGVCGHCDAGTDTCRGAGSSQMKLPSSGQLRVPVGFMASPLLAPNYSRCRREERVTVTGDNGGTGETVTRLHVPAA